MAKRVSMKGRGLEAVYGEFRTAPVRRTAGVDVYGQGGAPAKEADSSLLKRRSTLIARRSNCWRGCGSISAEVGAGVRARARWSAWLYGCSPSNLMAERRRL